MRSANLANQAHRQAEVGQVWEEKLTNAMGTLEINRFATFRVRATGATTVTIDGVLAMTMSAGEIALFNAGQGDPSPSGALVPTVPVVIAGAAAFVQVARDLERKQ
jgi:hypothetical protein